MYLLHCTWRCNILCSKHDIDMRMNEWNRHALFLSWNGRNRNLHSSLLKIWDFFHSWEKFSVFPLVPLRSTREKTEFLTWKKSQIFNRDSCKNLLVFAYDKVQCNIYLWSFSSPTCPAHKLRHIKPHYNLYYKDDASLWLFVHFLRMRSFDILVFVGT